MKRHFDEHGCSGAQPGLQRMLADIRSGRIEVDSTVGQGSCFQVRLPRRFLRDKKAR